MRVLSGKLKGLKILTNDKKLKGSESFITRPTSDRVKETLFNILEYGFNINFSKIKEGFQKYFPIGSLIGFILFIEIILMVFSGDLLVNKNNELNDNIPNTHKIGSLLYTEYIYVFQLSGLILLVAMVGAIVLTLREAVMKNLKLASGIILYVISRPSKQLPLNFLGNL